MKKTKRVLAMLLSVILTMSAAVQVAFATQDPTTLDDHLVVHYDFEGATVADALKDKSTGGSVKDDLKAYIGGTLTETSAANFASTFAIDPVNGTASNLTTNAALLAAISDDLKCIYTENSGNYGTATWFVRFKIDDVDSADSCVLEMRTGNAGNNCLFTFTTNAAGNLYTRTATTSKKSSTTLLTQEANGVISDGVYVNIALVMQAGQGASGYDHDMYFTPYIAYGNPTSAADWTKLAEPILRSFRDEGFANVPLSLFDRGDCAGSNNTTLTYDDVRLYNKGLTTAEMQEIFDTGSFANKAPTMVGHQTKASAEAGKSDMRLLAVVNKLEGVKEFGYKIEQGDNSTEISCKYVYTSVLETYANQTTTLNATDEGGNYFIALHITGIPDGSVQTFTVTPFTVATDGTVYYGSPQEITLNTAQ